MTWKQVIYYYNCGWEAKRTEAKVFWGTYGALLNNEKGSHGNSISSIEKPKQSLDEIRKCYPGYENAYIDKHGRLVKE